MSKITNGLVVFSLLMALSLGVAFAESEVAATENVTENASANESVSETEPATINATNETNTTVTEPVKV
ncbi:Uncharacterised protein [uncultured archaeon]|nr:Uncharacterised protein [uncultured archaeon]